jgi:hypothetical protein
MTNRITEFFSKIIFCFSKSIQRKPANEIYGSLIDQFYNSFEIADFLQHEIQVEAFSSSTVELSENDLKMPSSKHSLPRKVNNRKSQSVPHHSPPKENDIIKDQKTKNVTNLVSPRSKTSKKILLTNKNDWSDNIGSSTSSVFDESTRNSSTSSSTKPRQPRSRLLQQINDWFDMMSSSSSVTSNPIEGRPSRKVTKKGTKPPIVAAENQNSQMTSSTTSSNVNPKSPRSQSLKQQLNDKFDSLGSNTASTTSNPIEEKPSRKVTKKGTKPPIVAAENQDSQIKSSTTSNSVEPQLVRSQSLKKQFNGNFDSLSSIQTSTTSNPIEEKPSRKSSQNPSKSSHLSKDNRFSELNSSTTSSTVNPKSPRSQSLKQQANNKFDSLGSTTTSTTTNAMDGNLSRKATKNRTKSPTVAIENQNSQITPSITSNSVEHRAVRSQSLKKQVNGKFDSLSSTLASTTSNPIEERPSRKSALNTTTFSIFATENHDSQIKSLITSNSTEPRPHHSRSSQQQYRDHHHFRKHIKPTPKFNPVDDNDSSQGENFEKNIIQDIPQKKVKKHIIITLPNISTRKNMKQLDVLFPLIKIQLQNLKII